MVLLLVTLRPVGLARIMRAAAAGTPPSAVAGNAWPSGQVSF